MALNIYLAYWIPGHITTSQQTRQCKCHILMLEMDGNFTWLFDLRSLDSTSGFMVQPKAEEVDYGIKHDTGATTCDQAHLLLLPVELRMGVYQHMLLTHGNPNRHIRRREQGSGTRRRRGRRVTLPVDNLMLTCRRLYTEISGLVSKFAILHIQKRIQLGSKYSSPSLPRHLHSPFWHVPPRIRTAQTVIGRWDASWTCPYTLDPRIGYSPTVPFDLVQRNDFHWKCLEMRLDTRLPEWYGWSSPNQILDLQQITRAFTEEKVLYRSIDDFMNFGEQDGLHVSVIITIRMNEPRSSDPLCKAVIHGGVITVPIRHESLPPEDQLLRLFHLYFHEGKNPEALRRAVSKW